VDEIALQTTEVVDKEYAVQMVDLVL